MRRTSILVFAAVLATCLGCTDGEPVSVTGNVVLRFIDDDPEVTLSSSPNHLIETAFEWHWDAKTSPLRWDPIQARLRIPRRGGLLVQIDGTAPALEADVDLKAEDIHLLELEMRGLGRRPLELVWSNSGRDFSDPERRVSTARIEDREGALIYQFSPANNPAWTGTVTGLRIAIPGDKVERFRIHSFSGLRRIEVPKWASATSASPHKVDLDHDTRNALVAPPDIDHARSLQIPANATFAFAFGAPKTIDAPVSFTVEINESDGPTTTIFAEEIGPGTGASAGHWHERVIDLGRFAGSEATITLATSSPKPVDPELGFPMWANPEVVARTEAVSAPNVVLICLDTLRADGLSSYGNPLPTSPRIDAWAADRGVLFENAVAGAPWTLPSHTTMFTGLDAVRHGVNFTSAAPPELEMLAERLRRNGYTTGAFTGGGYLGNGFGFIQGFDTFSYWPAKQTADEFKWVTEQTLEWLGTNRDRPFFLFVHTYEVHYPHRRRQPFFNRFAKQEKLDPPKGNVQMRPRGWKALIAEGDVFVIRRPGAHDWVGPLTDDENRMVRLMYHSAVAYADTKVGAILDRLVELGIDDRTMVILTSDHGEALGEDGRAGHYYLDDFNVMVPLIIEFPGRAGAGTTIDRQVRSVDLVPTIMESVGLSVPTDLDGRSLVPMVADGPSAHPGHAWTYAGSSNRGLGLRIDNKTKYIFPDTAWSELADREAIYDLEADPEQRNDLIADHPRRDEFRATTRETILEQHVGYRLEIINQGSDTLEGRLAGRWSMHDRVKIADHSCNCVHWKEDERATFRLPPGEKVELLFAELKGFEAGLKGRLVTSDGRATSNFNLDFELDKLELPAAAVPTAAGWRLIEGAEGRPPIGFYLRVAGDRVPGSGETPGPDQETLEQLRALGYVE